ncbi:hypothetical protein, partial [Parasutterella excrementihominis]|uniref:hypothetical protein n=1 Tax=Parasutterella excrementihominis TaxID=487175 RepID=UPI003140856C
GIIRAGKLQLGNGAHCFVVGPWLLNFAVNYSDGIGIKTGLGFNDGSQRILCNRRGTAFG